MAQLISSSTSLPTVNMMQIWTCLHALGSSCPKKSKGLKQEQGSQGDEGGEAEASGSVAVCAVAGSR